MKNILIICGSYFVGRVFVEELVKEKSKFHYTSLRPAIIYGKYNYAPRESWFFNMIHQDKTIILPDNELALFQFVSVWDLANNVLKSKKQKTTRQP